ncbi:MAG TPA: hypothetical protein PLG59_01490, partial [bacterium]|nr:hypothetical protein [bacterium]
YATDSTPSMSGLRIHSIALHSETFLVRHELSPERKVSWRFRPLNSTMENLLIPSPDGSQVKGNLSTELIEPSPGMANCALTMDRKRGLWDLSSRQEIRIDKAEALNPYLPDSVPLTIAAGILAVSDTLSIQGTQLDTTVNVALYQADFEPRERSVTALFTGGMSQFAVKAIQDAQGDIILDPIRIQGDLNDPKFDPKNELMVHLRNQVLGRIFRGSTTIPKEAVQQLTAGISSLPSNVLGGAEAIFGTAEKLTGKVGSTAKDAGAGVAGTAQKAGETATDAAKTTVEGVGSVLKGIFNRDKKEE